MGSSFSYFSRILLVFRALILIFVWGCEKRWRAFDHGGHEINAVPRTWQLHCAQNKICIYTPHWTHLNAVCIYISVVCTVCKSTKNWPKLDKNWPKLDKTWPKLFKNPVFRYLQSKASMSGSAGAARAQVINKIPWKCTKMYPIYIKCINNTLTMHVALFLPCFCLSFALFLPYFEASTDWAPSGIRAG